MTLQEIKTELIAAHRAQDWEEAKRLSQLKQKAKKKNKHCCDCGIRIQSHAIRCRQCWVTYRFYFRSIKA